MTVVALWLLAVGIADLVRWRADAPPARQVVAAMSAAVTTAAVLALGGEGPGSVALHASGTTLLVASWLVGSAWSAAAGRPAWPGLVASAAGAVAVLALSGTAPELDGPLLRWYDALPLEVLDGVPLERFLTVVGAAVFLTASANVVVRLVLESAGSSVASGEQRLKGGRLLGPMERLFLFGLGLAGNLTAAAIIVAAKGLLRFPELARAPGEPVGRIDELTEYFLIGSMASWLLALSLLVVT